MKNNGQNKFEKITAEKNLILRYVYNYVRSIYVFLEFTQVSHSKQKNHTKKAQIRSVLKQIPGKNANKNDVFFLKNALSFFIHLHLLFKQKTFYIKGMV